MLGRFPNQPLRRLQLLGHNNMKASYVLENEECLLEEYLLTKVKGIINTGLSHILLNIVLPIDTFHGFSLLGNLECTLQQCVI